MSRSLLLLVAALFAVVLAPVATVGAEIDCDIIGTEGDDVLIGTDADEVICGLGGDDLIRAGRGNDVIHGGPGDDRIFAGPGHDIVRAGSGDDTIRGQNGRDRVFGQLGADIVDGGAGRDRLRGGPGLDTCTDPRGRTSERGCEGPAEFALARWEALEIGEYVLELRDEFAPLVVRVRNGATVVPLDGDAPTAEDVIAGAADLDDVTFAPDTGLPDRTSIDGVEWQVTHFERRDLLRADLERARSHWSEAEVQAYTSTVVITCFCLGPTEFVVTVADGVIRAVDDVDGEPIDAPPAAALRTVGEHLAAIEMLLDGSAVSVSARFDETFGVPTSYAYDLSSIVADEEAAITISDFEVERAPDDPADLLEVPLVVVAGIEVHESIAEDVAALVEAAAADGFTLSGGGYRDPAAQIALRRINCGPTDYDIYEKPAAECSPPTARPGRSLHETGLAIDFTNEGRLVTSTADPAYVWLAENAATYGLFNHPAEPWHWSINGN